MSSIKNTNIAPGWPLCKVCNTYKADGLLDDVPICANCAFEKGWLLQERFAMVWRRRY
jgi:hypothetical protein